MRRADPIGSQAPGHLVYHHAMVIATGTVRDGRIELPGGPLPEGTVVMVLVVEGAETFELDFADEARLTAAIQEASRGEVVSAGDLFAQLRHM